MGNVVGSAVQIVREYKNWPEVMALRIKRQEPTKVLLRNGLTIEAPVTLKGLVNEIFFKKMYDPNPLTIGWDDIVVDIGANWGVFTLYAATMTRNAVHAFEPSPYNFKILQKNIATNKLRHVFAHQYAVSDKVGVMSLCLNSQNGRLNLLSEHIIPEKIERYKEIVDLNYLTSRPGTSGTTIEVPTTSLQAIMDDHHLERIDFLKMNCEGAEGSIIHTAPLEYLSRVKKIAMEFHDQFSQFSHMDMQKKLQTAGFITDLEWDRQSPVGLLYAWRS